MFNLQKTERAIIAFLSLTLILGLAITVYAKYHPRVSLKIEKFDLREKISNQKVNINEAGIGELMTIKGIGRKLAERIIDYRDKKGSFSSAGGIRSVKGVGEALFEKIKDDITTE